jgi:hypothetical protein
MNDALAAEGENARDRPQVKSLLRNDGATLLPPLSHANAPRRPRKDFQKND